VDNDSKKDTSVSISVIQFVDRAVQEERRLQAAELSRVADVITTKLDAHRELLADRFTLEDKANKIAYSELQQHLAKLNAAHEEKQRDMAHYLPRETHDRFIEEFKVWRDQVNSTLSNNAGRSAAYAGVIGLVVVSVEILLHFWK
jgi:hypothetical protein